LKFATKDAPPDGKNCNLQSRFIERKLGPNPAVCLDMTPGEMRARTELFAVEVIRFTNPLLEKLTTRSFADQVRRSATSTAQSYSACTIAKSRRDFVSKLRLALEEADESARWLRMLRDTDLAAGPELAALIREATQLAAILGASCSTAERNNK
jgi:four helix bundle protein